MSVRFSPRGDVSLFLHRPMNCERVFFAMKSAHLEGTAAKLAATRAAAGATVAVGDLCAVKWGSVRFEATVEDVATDRGLRVQIDGPHEKHDLLGASIWVTEDDVQGLKVPKDGLLPGWLTIGSTVRTSLRGDEEDVLILDRRQGLKRGIEGARFKVCSRSGERMWLRYRDILAHEDEDEEGEEEGEEEDDDDEGEAAPSTVAAPITSPLKLIREGAEALAAALADAEVDEAGLFEESGCAHQEAEAAAEEAAEEEEAAEDAGAAGAVGASEAVRASGAVRAAGAVGASEAARAPEAAALAAASARDVPTTDDDEEDEDEDAKEDEDALCAAEAEDGDAVAAAPTAAAAAPDTAVAGAGPRSLQRERGRRAPTSAPAPSAYRARPSTGAGAKRRRETTRMPRGKDPAAADSPAAAATAAASTSAPVMVSGATEASSSAIPEGVDENEAVLVRWGHSHCNAVVLKLDRKRARGVKVQFDSDRTLAWVAGGAVRLMPEAPEASLPAWACVGGAVLALDPDGSPSKWYAAVLEEAKAGVADKDDDGLRLWVRYTKSQLCQWVKRLQVREAGAEGGAVDDGGDGSAKRRRPASSVSAGGDEGDTEPDSEEASEEAEAGVAMDVDEVGGPGPARIQRPPPPPPPPPPRRATTRETEEEEAARLEAERLEAEKAEAEEELEANEAVVVQYGRKQYNAVVLQVDARKPKGVRVQFDVDRSTAWVAAAAVRVMADFAPSELPRWARVGAQVEAVDPNGERSVWHAATVEEAVRGVQAKDDDGLRLWIRYRASGLCQWVQRAEVREPGTTTAAAAATVAAASKPAGKSAGKSAGKASGGADGDESYFGGGGVAASATLAPAAEPGSSIAARRHVKAAAAEPAASRAKSSVDKASLAAIRVVELSCAKGRPGAVVWALLERAPAAGVEYLARFVCSARADLHSTRLLAPNVVACTVPARAGLRGRVRLELCSRPHAQPDAPPIPLMGTHVFEVLDDEDEEEENEDDEEEEEDDDDEEDDN